MKKLYTLLVLYLLAFTASAAQKDSTSNRKLFKNSKVNFKFGGFMDARLIFDSHDSFNARNGLIYFYPTAPVYDNNGTDIANQNQLRFSVLATRLNVRVSNIKLLNADAYVHVEGDFCGTKDDYSQLFRIRLAYMKLQWEKSSLLFGQAYNLNFADQVISPSVDIAGGLPYNPLNRGGQICYSYAFTDNFTIKAAAEMFEQHRSIGPLTAQYDAVIPNMDIQFAFGNTNSIYGGVTIGGKYFKPRRVDNNGDAINKKVGSMSISSFLKIPMDGYWLRLWGIYGGNITYLNMIGGYGKSANQDVNGDYDYENIRTLSTWADFETPIFNKFQFGIFAGLQKNMGSKNPLDLNNYEEFGGVQGYYRDCMLQWYGRISPRITYHPIKQTLIGLEYGYNMASWAKEVDDHYKATSSHETVKDNRIILSLTYLF